MDQEAIYTIRRYYTSNGGGGKFHILAVGTRSSICGVEFRNTSYARYPFAIEEAIQALGRKNGRRTRERCKNCMRAAQKLRSPLDRMAEV